MPIIGQTDQQKPLMMIISGDSDPDDGQGSLVARPLPWRCLSHSGPPSTFLINHAVSHGHHHHCHDSSAYNNDYPDHNHHHVDKHLYHDHDHQHDHDDVQVFAVSHGLQSEPHRSFQAVTLF